MPRILVLFPALVFLVAAPLAHAQKEAPTPNYICPNAATPLAVDCFIDAVEHLYTMCRHVKSIEIIEFGYEKSEDGVNGAKSEYCVDKQKLSMTRPYQSALREATGNKNAVDGLRSLHELWVKSLTELKWKPGESDADYKQRTAKPYDDFREGAVAVRTALPAKGATPAKSATPAKGSSTQKPAAPAKAKPASDAGKSAN